MKSQLWLLAVEDQCPKHTSCYHLGGFRIIRTLNRQPWTRGDSDGTHKVGDHRLSIYKGQKHDSLSNEASQFRVPLDTKNFSQALQVIILLCFYLIRECMTFVNLMLLLEEGYLKGYKKNTGFFFFWYIAFGDILKSLWMLLSFSHCEHQVCFLYKQAFSFILAILFLHSNLMA